jgi:hypothetical protein
MIMMVMQMCFIVVLVIDIYRNHSGIFLNIVFKVEISLTEKAGSPVKFSYQGGMGLWIGWVRCKLHCPFS